MGKSIVKLGDGSTMIEKKSKIDNRLCSSNCGKGERGNWIRKTIQGAEFGRFFDVEILPRHGGAKNKGS
ncbi:hypothetical protein NPIL_316241 [Nephila pilipes]|uniref:Uncharacterized protein n=1 Tax=Nephila pilipes TaxID=299642 RepID=A0A8X6THY5_NEPPI|nr:hypothetical protein NPIL_316241 [Nephila pilipes]